MDNKNEDVQLNLKTQQVDNENLEEHNKGKLSGSVGLESEKISVHEAEALQTALDVLIKKREKDKKIIEKRITDNINKLVVPFIKKLKNTALSANQEELVECLESNLDNIKSSFIENLDQKFLHFTPMEIQVASLVRDGKSNKEIAELLCRSINTILSHRSRVRQKLGLKNKKVNLRSYLLSFK